MSYDAEQPCLNGNTISWVSSYWLKTNYMLSTLWYGRLANAMDLLCSIRTRHCCIGGFTDSGFCSLLCLKRMESKRTVRYRSARRVLPVWLNTRRGWTLAQTFFRVHQRQVYLPLSKPLLSYVWISRITINGQKFILRYLRRSLTSHSCQSFATSNTLHNNCYTQSKKIASSSLFR